MEFAFEQYLAIAVCAFFAQVVGGVAGYGTGLILPLVLVPLIGPEATIPVIALSSIITNPARVFTFREHLNLKAAKTVILFGFPPVLLGAYLYTLLTGMWAQIAIGVMLVVMVPTARYFRRRKMMISDAKFKISSGVFGLVMGATSGSGVILLSILMARGLVGPAVVATDAAASTILGFAKVGVFAGAGALPADLLLLSIAIGLMAVPGTWVAKWMAARMTYTVHNSIMDVSVLCGGVVMLANALMG
jgi:uncharacterized membrane protein YfcA